MSPFVPLAFDAINLAIMPLWFGLLFLPRKRWVSPAIDGFFAVAALVFVVNLIPGLPEALPVIIKPTLAAVGRLLSTPEGTLGSWTHFVIGDLWMGRWIGEDARTQGISRAWVSPILVLTLLFGPLGLLTYFIVKLVLKGRFGTSCARTSPCPD